ncbi:class III poly(R)-hydroxyalkanoic acid synthase subunit PhaE [Stenotrophomonas sp. HITSZ_GD]|uniref:class III poly(R)-hydroxyalkanoic acid synthase subunit PhaE n=1 Tax=Stenotrophomonas sp. HITSZ_GD TaxID=3037248 RepID=UPI00240E17D3|nr:class III poly(R)-hydroxyalkanoic acid synthase subunit PhaE [Stenotrophomonas sp. HITSZ_GD]MDG2524301.1 class III poly(R)-hydroxyalkanoic acid synthase subunit PhaE [Stenotrophomonas sp. HITSZ_GD]
MTANGDDPGQDAQAQARRYWEAWSQALQHGSAAAVGGTGARPGEDPAGAGWTQALGWWRTLLGEGIPGDTRGPVDRASHQAGDWLGLMQDVAARFAGRDTSSAEVAGAWREAVQGQGDDMLQWVLGALRGGTAGGFDPWLQQAAQTLEQWRRDSAPWLDMPAMGLGRNHQSRWQDLVRLQQDYQAQSQAYLQQLRAALDRAFDLFQAKLAEHEALGSQLTSARALFDLWIEAAEEAYNAVALSDEFREIYGAFANAHMRLRAALQREVEQVAGQYGMPTRSEMDAAHKRIAELERTVRRLVAAVGEGAARAAPSRGPTPRPAPKPAPRPAAAQAKPSARATAPAKKPGRAPAKEAAKQATASRPAAKKAAARTAAAAKRTTR